MIIYGVSWNYKNLPDLDGYNYKEFSNKVEAIKFVSKIQADEEYTDIQAYRYHR